MDALVKMFVADLRPGEMLKVRRAAGAIVRVDAGAVWVTEGGRAGDAVLPAGACYRVERGRAVVIEALGAARISIRPVTPVRVRTSAWASLAVFLPAFLRRQ